MSTTPSALERNANAAAAAEAGHSEAPAASSQPSQAAQPSAGQSRKRPFNLQQELLVREFVRMYNISPDQISFDSVTGKPFFFFEALAQIVTALINFSELRAQQVEINQARGYVTSEASITLPDSRVVSSFGSAFLNEELPTGENVTDFLTALDISRARALRSALRMVGFDPVRAHEAAKRGDNPHIPQITAEDEQRNKELAEIHILAEACGLIVGDDKTKYYQQIDIWFTGKTSSAQLDAQERSQFIALLRGTKAARERAHAAQ